MIVSRWVGSRRLLHISDHALTLGTVRVDEQGDHPRLGNQLGQQFEPLGVQLDEDAAEAREIAARLRETGDQAVRDRVAG
jgi:hypothetical protein